MTYGGRFRPVVMAVAAALIAIGPGCGKRSEEIKIGFLVKQPEEMWFQREWKFAGDAGRKYGFQLVTMGAQDGEKTLNDIDSLATQGAQGFVICTPDTKLGPSIVAKAQAANLKVFTVDDQFVGADGKFMDVPYMGISARAIGEMVGKALYDEYKKRGWTPDETGAMAVTHDELNTVKERTDGATDALVKAGFPADRIYRSAEKTTDVPGSMDAATIVLTQHPEIKKWLIFSVNDEGVLGAVRATEGRGLGVDSVVGIGIGGTTTATDEWKKDKPTGFFATVLISPKRHGYETAEYLYKWIKDGVAPPKDTRTTGILIDRSNYARVLKEQGL